MKSQILLFLLLLWCRSVSAHNIKGISLYLPLKIDSQFELEIEKLSSYTAMPVLSKPYHLATIKTYLPLIKSAHPKTYFRITHYLTRYKSKKGITNYSAQVNINNGYAEKLANLRGIATRHSVAITADGYIKPNDFFAASVGFQTFDKFAIPLNSFFTFGYEFLQVDVGYKDHWFSPNQESSTLISTNAKTPFSISFSNSQSLTSWNINYEFFIAQLSRVEGIHFAERKSSGMPKLSGMHISFQLTDWLSIAGNRTLMFGGGERKVSFKDFINATFNATRYDNCGGDSVLQNCNFEFGNQQMSLVTKLDLNIGTPLTFNYEFAAEDTKNLSNWSFGNIARTASVFFPDIMPDVSFYVEYSNFHEAWYIHHLYDQGYRNNNNVIGHWWGDHKLFNDGVGANVLTLRANWEFYPQNTIQIKYKTVVVNGTGLLNYVADKQVEITYFTEVNENQYKLNFLIGNNLLNKHIFNLNLSLSW